MIFFVSVLRAIAACLITNAHYTGIYPTDLIANGGLLGDVLFFSISGYCLCDIKNNFMQWYTKRVYRVYIPVWIITVIYVLLGFYQISERGFVGWFLYPTGYHFVASIIILYIPFFIIMKLDVASGNLTKIMISIAILWFVIYCGIYDNSYYHIDSVREPFIRFLFMESMLLGAWFKKNDKVFRNQFKWNHLGWAIILFVAYFSSKLLFSKIEELAEWQFINQIIIFVLLYYIFRVFSGIDKVLEKLPCFIKRIIKFISSITLEIYVVQYILIDLIRPIGNFPFNWIILTTAIFVAAWLLHRICEGIYRLVDVCLRKVSKENRG